MTVIIVSGSRHATSEHRPVIAGALARFRPVVPSDPSPVTLVHGDARGVDRIAAALVTTWGWDVVAYPADWARCDDTIPVSRGGCPPRPHLRHGARGTYCPYAGHRRNQLMLDTHPGAIAACFPACDTGTSSGTGDFIDRAIRSGIRFEVRPLHIVRAQQPLPVAAHSPTA